MSFVKRLLNVFLIILGVALMIVCADLVSNKLGNTKLESLSETDRAAIEEICTMTELFDSKHGNEEIWDERYNLRKQPCLLTRSYGMLKGYTYGVNMSVPKSIFAQQITMPAEYGDVIVCRFAYLTPFTFGLKDDFEGSFTDAAGERAFAIAFDMPVVKTNGTGSLEENYISRTFEDAVESVDVPNISDSVHFEIDEENVALTGLQYRIIDDMLGAKDKEELDMLIAEYVKVREYQAENHGKFADVRKRRELDGGCTRFVFYNVSGLIGHDITYFNKEATNSITFYSAYYYLCTGRYNSDIGEFLDKTGVEYEGAALCRIIDENEIAEDWQLKLDSSDGNFTSQYDIIKKYCEKNCGKYSETKIEDIKKSYNYDEITSMAHTLVEAL